MIDVHAHLDLFTNALAVAEEANEVNYFTLAVTTSPRAWVATSKVFKKYQNIKVGLGLHPEIAMQKSNELDLLISLISEANYIGEIGIDGSSKYSKTLEVQHLIFRRAICECDKVGGRIISIHSRGAASDVLSYLRKYPGCGKTILHWFSGTLSELKTAIELGCYFSVNTQMLNSKKGRYLVSNIPSKLLLPESDGPFAQLHNKPIMPWEAINVADILCSMWNLSISETKEKLFDNLRNLLI